MWSEPDCKNAPARLHLEFAGGLKRALYQGVHLYGNARCV